ncbi:peptidase M29 [Acuticoccus sp. M5D2P5]|uniref:peptidase M29 n=1 Tax=Acuticoccus kalidii TaxID=2910977 RepID=UPI001F2D6EE8|nr:peptidase M29 [Acuticoccus kalidii]MCF3933577.1 peptidase M29 [Acuticoccus kalidii]
MFSDRIEGKWIDAFAELFEAARIGPEESVVILSESGSREVNVHVAELALVRRGVRPARIVVPTPRLGRMIPRSTGASRALTGQPHVVAHLKSVDVVVDLTLEGLMHAPETAEILRAGTRIQVISNEHPETLERMGPDPDLKERVREAVRRCRAATTMRVTSTAGSDLAVDMRGANTAGVWGWTDRPGTLAHWPGGIVVSFPAAGTVAGRLVLQPGDMNLTYKRYVEGTVALTLGNDRVVAVDGDGVDARLMRDTWSAWRDANAYAVSHVGWGLNEAARWDALMMMDKVHTNATELRAVAGNFLFSTGANEFADRFTEGHFDLPMMGCTIALDGVAVVEEGRLV